MQSISVDFDLWPKQLLALTSDAQVTLYGGAAGSGKSHVSRVAATTAALTIPGVQVFLFRRHYKDLQLNHMEGPTGFPALLSDLCGAGICEIVDGEIRFPKLGSKIHLCHCQYDKDVFNYKGAEFHFLIPEEATEFTEFQLRFLFSRVRIPDTLKIPPEEKHKWPRILLPTNPGGPGHTFIKTTFIDGKNPGEVWKQADMDGGRTCTFIPARLADNPSIDPVQYRSALLGLKRQELIDAMLDGKWDIPLGAFFPECDERKHVIDFIELPRHLLKFRTFDWGSGAPFCVQWWAVADNKTFKRDGTQIPSGALICYREWYGCNPHDTKKGIGLSNRQMVEGILERTNPDEIIYDTLTDSLPFQARGGLTIAEEFWNKGNYPSVMLTQGDTSKGSRVVGWQQLRSRLIGIDDVPYIYFVHGETSHTWRTLTEIQVDDDPKKKGEDLDTMAEDHPVDAAGMACKAHLFVKNEPVNKKPVFIHEAKAEQLFETHIRLKRQANGLRR